MIKVTAYRLRLYLCVAILLMLSSCVSVPVTVSDNHLIDSIVDYRHQVTADDPDTLEHIFFIEETNKSALISNFSGLPKRQTANELAHWLIAEDGYGLNYEVTANLTPNQVLEQKLGNCLSFTLLLVEIASELGVELDYNQVDLPDTWGMDSAEDMIFYRHVNAILDLPAETMIFDLAIENYRSEYPQRKITRTDAAAMFLSNRGIDDLAADNTTRALHRLKLAISYSPQNPDIWINIGAAFKQTNQLDKAEAAYLRALELGDVNGLAASNLERLYRALGRYTLAKRYERFARKARIRNPYMQYHLAQQRFSDEKPKQALKHINRAISVHNKDPQFFELRSRINQLRGNYVAALRDLEKAFKYSGKDENRIRYQSKIESVAATAAAKAKEQRNSRGGHYQVGTELERLERSLNTL